MVSALVRLKQSRTPADLVRVAGALLEWLWDPRDDELKRVFADWVQKLSRRLVPDEVELVPVETLEGVKMTLEERVAEWPRQLLREGREQGMREGIEKGIEQGCLRHERALLRRQAAPRFGAQTAERFSGMLAHFADPEHLADVGGWMVRCETGDEFLARVDSTAGPDRHGG